jgi:cytochrome c oxidase subunit 2
MMIRLLLVSLSLFSYSIAFGYDLTPWHIDFQEAVSPVMRELHDFHNFLLIIITLIVIIVFILLFYVAIRFNAKANPVPNKFTHNITIEVIWTVIPVIILAIIAVPSFRILKLVEHAPPSEFVIKVVGNQWYWNYSYPDHGGFNFDSNIIADKDIKQGEYRLLEVDNRILIPENTVVKFLITAADVVHSFAVPALGIKTDAVPGKINETWTKVERKGVYYGQCSELCGVKHGFMPIAVEVVTKEEFDKWVMMAKQRFAKKNDTNFYRIAQH